MERSFSQNECRVFLVVHGAVDGHGSGDLLNSEQPGVCQLTDLFFCSELS